MDHRIMKQAREVDQDNQGEQGRSEITECGEIEIGPGGRFNEGHSLSYKAKSIYFRTGLPQTSYTILD